MVNTFIHEFQKSRQRDKGRGIGGAIVVCMSLCNCFFHCNQMDDCVRHGHRNDDDDDDDGIYGNGRKDHLPVCGFIGDGHRNS